MLIASSRSIVGPTNSHAIARSERPRIRTAAPTGVACAARVTMTAGFCIGDSWVGAEGGRLLRLAVVLEDLLPIDHQRIECLLRGALVGDHVIMHALLH